MEGGEIYLTSLFADSIIFEMTPRASVTLVIIVPSDMTSKYLSMEFIKRDNKSMRH